MSKDTCSIPGTTDIDSSRALPTSFCAIVQLLILTGMRRGEAAALRPSYINLEKRTVCLPSQLVKNGREFLFPVSANSAALLSKAIRRVPAAEFIFPARGNANRSFNGWSKSKIGLDKASGVSHWTLHDLRRTYRTIHARIGTPPHIAERLQTAAPHTLMWARSPWAPVCPPPLKDRGPLFYISGKSRGEERKLGIRVLTGAHVARVRAFD